MRNRVSHSSASVYNTCVAFKIGWAAYFLICMLIYVCTCAHYTNVCLYICSWGPHSRSSAFSAWGLGICIPAVALGVLSRVSWNKSRTSAFTYLLLTWFYFCLFLLAFFLSLHMESSSTTPGTKHVLNISNFSSFLLHIFKIGEWIGDIGDGVGRMCGGSRGVEGESYWLASLHVVSRK